MDSKKIIQTLQKVTELLSQDPTSLYTMIGPKSIQLEITNACNLKCIMCDRWKWGPDLEGNLTKEDLFSLVDELSALGTGHILISGGEPLLRKDFQELIQYIIQKGMVVTVISNGVFLSKDIATTLIESNATIILSIDGSNNVIYSKIRGSYDLFPKILENIKNFVDLRDTHKKGFISMHFVIQEQNVYDMVSFFELAKQLRVNLVSYGMIHGIHIPEKGIRFTEGTFKQLKINLEKLIELKAKEPGIQLDLRKELYAIHEGRISLEMLNSGLPVKELFEENPIPCLSLSYWAFIDAFGDVYPCCYAYFDNLDYEPLQSLRNRLCFGNIHKTSFQKIWAGKKFNKFRQAMNPVDIGTYPEVCGNCGSFFFFQEKWDNLNHLKEKLGTTYKNIESDLISIRDTILNCFAKPIDRAPKAYDSEIENVIRSLFKL